MREEFAERRAHSIVRLTVHLVWATHNREPWLDTNVDPWLSELLRDLSAPLGCHALAVGNASDHVHHRQAVRPEPWEADLALPREIDGRQGVDGSRAKRPMEPKP
jgi:Transposase IS200 like